MSAEQFKNETLWGNKIFTTQKEIIKKTLYVNIGLMWV